MVKLDDLRDAVKNSMEELNAGEINRYDSNSANSSYLTVNGFFIRVSDHISSRSESFHVSINLFANNDNLCMVLVRPSLIPLLLSLDELNSFIKSQYLNYLLIPDSDRNKKVNIEEETQEEKLNKANNYGELGTMIAKLYPSYSFFSKAKKNIFKQLYETGKFSGNDMYQIISYCGDKLRISKHDDINTGILMNTIKECILTKLSKTPKEVEAIS